MVNKEMMVTLSRGGTAERIVPLSKIVIPDLWHVAMRQRDDCDKFYILECWHICHDLKKELEQRQRAEQEAPLV